MKKVSLPGVSVIGQGRYDLMWVSFFLQMKEIPVETEETVQKLSENKIQSLCSTEHKNDPSCWCFCCWEGYGQPNVFWRDYFLQRQKCP